MPTLPVLRLLPAALIVLLTPTRAFAMGLGEATVRSTLGSPLHVEIALRTGPDEIPDEQCISILPLPGAGPDTTAALGLRYRLVQGVRRTLVIDSLRPVTEPFANVRVRLDCGGASLVRDYALLIDPPAGAASAPLFTASALAGAPIGQALPAAMPAAQPAAPAAAGKTPHQRKRTAAPGTASDNSHLRLDFGASAGAGGAAMPSRAGGIGALRLDHEFAPPTAVTTDLVAERERLRELRTLVLAGDNPIDRVLALQTQVNTLDGQLRALQGRPAGASPAVPADGTTSGASVPPAAPPTAAPVGPKLQAPADDTDAFTLGLWAAAALGLGLLGAGVMMLLRRRRSLPLSMHHSADQDLASALLAGERAPAPALDDDLLGPAQPSPRRRGVPDVPGSGRTRVPERKPAPPVVAERVATDASANGEDVSQAARSAYLTARFPELAAGLIQLADPDSVVAGARLYVDHGDQDRANELLEAAIQGPCENDVRPWLALFELHRLRQEASPYAVLLERFRARFVASRYIPEILAVGRQLDPGRAEFQAPEGAPPLIAAAEGTTWLNPELDFVPQALAQELHDTLMAELADDEPPSGSERHDGGLHR